MATCKCNKHATKRKVWSGLGLEPEISAQIDVADLLVIENLLGVPTGDDVAIANDVGDIANIQGFTHVVVGDQDADVAFFECADNGFDFADRNRVDPGKGFVE